MQYILSKDSVAKIQLLMSTNPNAGDWERGFIESMKQKTDRGFNDLSPKQDAVWQRIADKYLKDQPTATTPTTAAFTAQQANPLELPAEEIPF